MQARSLEPFHGLSTFASSPLHVPSAASSAEVSPDIDDAMRESIELRVLWGTNVLHVEHLSPPNAFYVGDGSDPTCNFILPAEALRSPRTPLVTFRDGGYVLVVPRGALAALELPGKAPASLETLVGAGLARPSTEASGAYEIDLPFGARARVSFGATEVSFEIAVVRAARRVGTGLLATLDPSAHAYTGMSALMHIALVASFAFFMPTMNAEAAESMDRAQIDAMKVYLNTIAERNKEHLEDAETALNAADDREGGSGQRAAGEEGAAGTPLTKNTQGRYGVAGPSDNPDPHLARQRALNEIRTSGMVGLLASDMGADAHAPIAAWGRDDALGRDAKSALGQLWGASLDDAFGTGGLGLTGTGEGGGCENGSCEGIGLDHVGNLGHGAGGGPDGQGIGPGNGGTFSHGRLPPTHVAKAPGWPREGKLSVGGTIPAEVIQRIVRQNFGRFRLCYENGLRGNPSLEGRVAVKFIIDRGGAVSVASDGGSDLPDASVVSCIVRGFGNLSFPQPDRGLVTVVYPIVFSPGS